MKKLTNEPLWNKALASNEEIFTQLWQALRNEWKIGQTNWSPTKACKQAKRNTGCWLFAKIVEHENKFSLLEKEKVQLRNEMVQIQ